MKYLATKEMLKLAQQHDGSESTSTGSHRYEAIYVFSRWSLQPNYNSSPVSGWRGLLLPLQLQLHSSSSLFPAGPVALSQERRRKQWIALQGSRLAA
jgi:hypothetical protein